VLGTLAALCNAEGTGSCRAAPAFRTPRKNMCRSAEAPEPGVAYRGRFEAALYCQIPRSAAFIAHRKGCAVRRMRVGLAPPILAVRPGGPCALIGFLSGPPHYRPRQFSHCIRRGLGFAVPGVCVFGSGPGASVG
jgi:hypothetical protein